MSNHFPQVLDPSRTATQTLSQISMLSADKVNSQELKKICISIYIFQLEKFKQTNFFKKKKRCTILSDVTKKMQTIRDKEKRQLIIST